MEKIKLIVKERGTIIVWVVLGGLSAEVTFDLR